MSSERVINCIAGGPSLKGFDFSKIKGFSIGANRAAVEAHADVCVSIDTNFANKCEDVLKNFRGEVIIASPNKAREYPWVTYYKRSRQEWIPDDPKSLNGLESGYAAVVLAVHLGATHINLYGYDMNGSKVSRFHEGYNWSNEGLNVSYPQWAKKYNYLKQDLDKRGITCTHYVGPEGSAIKYFPRENL